MKHILLIVLTIGLFSCNQQIDITADLQNRIDSLESKLANTYKPGFGDFMGSIQTHHAKLWFAGQNENWDLADFEIHELEEAIEDIQEYHAGRKETELIGMIIPALDSVEDAIEKKDPDAFKRNYNLLTNTCNTCHHKSDHGFVVIKIPEGLPYNNQDFKPLK
jgi:hypothetical protein